jgi:hypothetical protein
MRNAHILADFVPFHLVVLGGRQPTCVLRAENALKSSQNLCILICVNTPWLKAYLM